jgi:predicted nucleic acid-binding Zn ribbon protein
MDSRERNMPIFDYRNIADPNDVVERLFKQGDTIPDEFVENNSIYRKLPPTTGFKFKGSGFYATDYQRG